MTRTTTEVFEDHLAKRKAGQVEADIRENYAQDVVLLTGNGACIGHEGIRRSAAQLQETLGDAVFLYDRTLATDAYAYLEWSARSRDRVVCDGADSFVIENGKIVFQSVHYTPRSDKTQ